MDEKLQLLGNINYLNVTANNRAERSANALMSESLTETNMTGARKLKLSQYLYSAEGFETNASEPLFLVGYVSAVKFLFQKVRNFVYWL
jgi:hypothetical protein